MKIHSVSCRNSFVGSQGDEISGKRKKKTVPEIVCTIWSGLFVKKKKKEWLTFSVR